MAVFLIAHGLVHGLWFLAAWTSRRVGIEDGPWVLPGDLTITSWAGRILGALALVVLVLLVAGGIGLLGGQPAWRAVTQAGVYLSFVAVFPWSRVSPRAVILNTLFADLAILFLLALPVSVELVG